MGITLKDIAKRMDVTEATVSMALRDYPNISPKTRKQIQKLASDLGYRPNLAARNLRRENTRVIGVILPDVHFDYSQQLINGIKSILMERDYMPMLMISGWEYRQESRDIDCLLGYEIEALICLPIVGSQESYKRVVSRGVPLVFIGNGFDIPGTSWVGMDGYDAGWKITEHLLSLGHRRIAMITTDSTHGSRVLRARLEGYLGAIASQGIRPDKSLIKESILGNVETVEALVQELLALDDPPTAIFGISDPIAYAVMDALCRSGKKIPQDIAVAGIGNLSPSRFELVSLTTVVEEAYQIGRRAAEIAVHAVEGGKSKAVQEKIEGDLIIRKSTVGCP